MPEVWSKKISICTNLNKSQFTNFYFNNSKFKFLFLSTPYDLDATYDYHKFQEVNLQQSVLYHGETHYLYVVCIYYFYTSSLHNASLIT